MQCDLCGKTGEMYKTEIEGTIMTTCADCKKFGKTLAKVRETQKIVKQEQRIKPRKSEPVETITKNYSSLIKNTRENLGMNHKDFAKKLSEKESNIHAMESGKREPSIALARKIEKQLGIKLVEIHAEEDFKIPLKPGQAGTELTIGDFMTLKKRKKGKN